MKEKRKKFWNSAGGTVLLFVILFLIAYLVATIFCLLIYNVIISCEWFSLLYDYISVGIMGLVFIVYMIWRDRDTLKTMSRSYGNNNWKNGCLGLLVGFVSVLLLGLVALATGSITLSFKGMNFGFALSAFVFMALQCIGEEVMNRVFLFQRIVRAKGFVAAVIINSVIFSALHIFNLSAFKVGIFYSVCALIEIVAFGIFVSLTVYYGKNVWFAFGFHSAWNYCQNYILGLPNSGISSTESVLCLSGGKGNDSLTYSNIFGIEAAPTTIIFTVFLCVAVVVWGKKKQQKCTVQKQSDLT